MADYADTLTENSLTENGKLIASDRVEGTAVYGPNRDRLGKVENIMIDKRTGQAEYVVMSFGGFLGMGEDHYPLPWTKLDYDLEAGGYVVDIVPEKLKDAPHYARDERPDFDPAYSSQLGAYYGL